MIENKNWNKQEADSIAVAESSREETWKSKSYMGSVFMGDFDVNMTFPFPNQKPEDKAIGDEICAKIDAWCADNVDGEEIDRTECIPAHVWKGLADMGLFGIKIPTKYGGLGLSQTNYMRILSTIAIHCGSTAATLSAHQSIGVPQPLKLVGTEEQKQKYLPRLAKGEISAFALTEPGVGSDPAKMKTTAILSEDKKHWILNGVKLWCTNGVVADLLIVMATSGTVKKHGREINQITAFIVEANSPGLEILHRCKFMGIKAIENGLLQFTNVKVPVENVVGGVGKGLKVALATLNDGRLGIPAIAAHATEDLTNFSARWGKSRNQWGKNVGQHEAGADKLAKIASGAYAMKALSDYCASLSDGKKQDLRMEAAAAKMFNTELGWDLIDLGLQFRGGRGYETATSLEKRGESPMPYERGMRDARINRIVEGTTDVMHLFLARESLDGHMKHAKPLFSRSTTGTKIKTLFKCAWIYAFWFPKLFMPSFLRPFSGFDSELKPWLRAADRRAKKLARAFFFRMLRFGPNLANRQLTLNRIVDIGTEISVMGLVASRAQTEINNGSRENLTRAVYWLQDASLRIDSLFKELSKNCDRQANKLAAELMEKAEVLPEVDISHLTPITHREFGSELTSGKITKRKDEKGSSEADSAAAK